MELVPFPSDILPLPTTGSAEANVDVAIAGAGPVGLFLGVLLKQAGVDVAIFDPHIMPGQASKAAVTMPRSLEQLELGGVGSTLVKKGQALQRVRLCLGGGSWTGELTGVGQVPEACRHLARTIGQNFVEEELSKRFQQLGGRLYRASSFKNYVAAGENVKVEVERAAYIRPPAVLAEMPKRLTAVSSTTICAKYLVGCDGKQSAVRELMGTPYVGHDYGEKFLLSDVEIPDQQVAALGFDQHQFHIVLDATKGATLLFVHLQDQRWRTYFCQKGLTRENLTPEFLKSKWQEMLPAPGAFDPTEFKDMAFFEVSCKLANTYRRGRVFLAGDACHCHSPAGGQGMNTGLQDSANLAWKLTACLNRQATDKVLDSYEDERRPIAQWVLRNSDTAFSSLTTQRSAFFSASRRLLLKAVLFCVAPQNLPPAFLRGKMFGLTLSYAGAGTCRDTGALDKNALKAGDRLPDLACTIAAPSLETIYTLEILNRAPYTGLRIMLVAEAGTHPVADEVKSCIEQMRASLKQIPLVPVLYVASSSGQAAVQTQELPHFGDKAVDGCEPLSIIWPSKSDASKERLCAELCTRLRLKSGGRAILVVRPDGYIAVCHRGDWNSTPVAKALQDLGFVGSGGTE